MIILACDTATDFGVFVLCDETGHIIAAATAKHHRDLSARFFSIVDSLLASANLQFDQIDAFGVGLGPGSFTGVRIAVTTLRTLAQVTGKPLVGVCTLDVYADSVARANPGKQIAALLQSRRNELYAALYAPVLVRTNLFAATIPEVAASIGVAASQSAVVVCGPAATHIETISAPFVAIEAPPDTSLARLAATAIGNKQYADPLGLNPLYIVPPAINQHLDPRQASRLSPTNDDSPR